MGLEEFGIVSQFALAAGAAAASMVGIRVARRVANHEFQQGSLAILHDLTTGEVALARDVVGTFMYGEVNELGSLSRAQIVRAYYTLLWCVERVARGYAVMDTSGDEELRRAFCESVGWHTTEIITNLALLRRFLSVDDKEAWESLQRATGQLSKYPKYLEVRLIEEQTAAEIGERRSLQRKVATVG